MKELQRAVDMVADGKTRDEILNCQYLLEMYEGKKQLQFLKLESNLLDIGHGERSTKKDFDTASSKAQKEVPLPDYDPIVTCAAITLPALAK